MNYHQKAEAMLFPHHTNEPLVNRAIRLLAAQIDRVEKFETVVEATAELHRCIIENGATMPQENWNAVHAVKRALDALEPPIPAA